MLAGRCDTAKYRHGEFWRQHVDQRGRIGMPMTLHLDGTTCLLASMATACATVVRTCPTCQQGRSPKYKMIDYPTEEM